MNHSRNKLPQADSVYNQQTSLEQSGNIKPAYEIANDYFVRPNIRSWDANHERLFKNTLKLASELMVTPEAALTTAVRFVQTNAHNTFDDNIMSFLSLCDERMESEGQRARKDLEAPKSPFLKHVDLTKTIQDSVINASIEFTQNCYKTILKKIYKSPRFENLTHQVLRKAFDFTVKYNRADYHLEFIGMLKVFRSSIENPKLQTVQSMIDTQIIAYETSVSFKKYQRALEAINEAFTYSLKAPSLPPSDEEKIEIKKLEILQIIKNDRLASIQRANLIEFYTSHQGIKQDIDINNMTDLCIIETASAYLFEEFNSAQTTINFPQFLKQTSGVIPSQSTQLHRLLAKASESKLTEFVQTAETDHDPFAISDKYRVFLKEEANKFPEELIKKFSEYAALSIIKNIRLHYDSISFNDLKQFIPWMDIVPIENLLVYAARSNIIPAHINKATGYISLLPRSVQELIPSISNLNDKLKNIFDSFQTIQKEMPEKTKADDDKTNKEDFKRIYESQYEEYSKNRPSKAKSIHRQMEQQQEERLNHEREERERKQKEIEEQEKKKYREEELRNQERKRKEQQYQYHYIECSIIASRLADVDLKSFLQEPTESGINPTGKKSADLEFIEEKAKELKYKYVNEMRSNEEKVEEKMAEVKDEIGKQRLLHRYALKHRLGNPEDEASSLAKEAAIIPRLIKAIEKTQAKTLQEQKKVYQDVQKKCKSIESLINEKKAAYAQTREVKAQPLPPGKQPLPQPKPEEETPAPAKAEQKMEAQTEKKPEEEKPKEEEKKQEEEKPKEEEKKPEEEKPKEEEKKPEEEKPKEEEKKEQPQPSPSKKSAGWGSVQVSSTPEEVGLKSGFTSTHLPRSNSRENTSIPRSNSRENTSIPRSGSRENSFVPRSSSRENSFVPRSGSREFGNKSRGPHKQTPEEMYGSIKKPQPQPQPQPESKFSGGQSKFGGNKQAQPQPAASRFSGGQSMFGRKTQPQPQPQPPKPRKF